VVRRKARRSTPFTFYGALKRCLKNYASRPEWEQIKSVHMTKKKLSDVLFSEISGYCRQIIDASKEMQRYAVLSLESL
jgi:hypothetical protein